jgi:hypothetical protein
MKCRVEIGAFGDPRAGAGPDVAAELIDDAVASGLITGPISPGIDASTHRHVSTAGSAPWPTASSAWRTTHDQDQWIRPEAMR